MLRFLVWLVGVFTTLSLFADARESKPEDKKPESPPNRLIVIPAIYADMAVPEDRKLPAEKQAKLAQARKLWTDAWEAANAAKVAEAIAAAEKGNALIREIFRNDVRIVAALEFLADWQTELERWDAAGRTRTEIVALLGTAHGKDDWRVTDARLDLEELNRRAKMTAEDRQALRRIDEVQDRAGQLYRQGKIAEGIAAFDEALKELERLLGATHRRYLGSLSDQASRLGRAGDAAGAAAACERVIELRRATLGELHPDHIDSLYNLANFYRNAGRYTKAERVYRQVPELTRRVVGEDHPKYAGSLNNLAVLYDSLGKPAEAEPLHRRALELRRKALGAPGGDPGLKRAFYAVSLHNLGYLYYEAGEYDRAEPLFREALAVGRNAPGGDPASYLMHLGVLYRDTGDTPKAEASLLQARDALRRNRAIGSSKDADILNYLGGVYRQTGDLAKAESHYREALDLRRKWLGPEHPFYLASLNNLGLLYADTGEDRKAEELLKQGAERREDKSPASYATSLHNLAQFYSDTGDNARAEELFKQAVELARSSFGETHPNTATCLAGLASVYRARGKPALAEPLFQGALTIRQAVLARTADVQTEQGQINFARQLRDSLNGYLDVTSARPQTATETYAWVLRWKGQVFVRQRRQRALLAAANDPAAARIAADLYDATRQLAVLAGQAPKPDQAGEWRKKVADLAARRDRLEADLAGVSAGFRRQRELEQITPAGFRKLLPAKTGLIDYLVYSHPVPDPRGKRGRTDEPRLAAYVIRPDREVVRIDLGPTAPITVAVDDWRSRLRRGNPVVGPDDPAAVLRDKVWRPVTKHLDGLDAVLVSPDGDLSRLPFAALPGSIDNTYLIEELAVAVLPAPQALPDLLSTAAPTGDPALLTLGDVDYDAGAGRPADPNLFARTAAVGRGGSTVWKQLPGTRGEAEAVGELFRKRFPRGAVTPLSAAAATEDAVRRQAPTARFLHFATHGFFAPPTARSAATGGRETTGGYHPGLLSGLVLAGANGPIDPFSGADDGVLTAVEVADLDLRGVELAVLSACETGLGQTAGGEGVLGLQRAFQVAGARSVVATLWTIPDEPTRVLMERFYDNLWSRRMTRLEALRQAQHWMLREGKTHPGLKRGLEREDVPPPQKDGRLPPYYWAAFVLSGDWR